MKSNLFQLLRNISSQIVVFFSIQVPYHHLLGVLSFFTLSCGLLNLIGSEPYTVHLIIVGLVGVILSISIPLLERS